MPTPRGSRRTDRPSTWTTRLLQRPARETAVEDVSSAGTLAHTIPGSFAIPLVAQDGSLGGLSADGLPLGLQLIGRPFDEATVLRAAHAYEVNTPWRQKRAPI